jgi:hypothetical protein
MYLEGFRKGSFFVVMDFVKKYEGCRRLRAGHLKFLWNRNSDVCG